MSRKKEKKKRIENIIQAVALVLTVCLFFGAVLAVSKMISSRNSSNIDSTTYAGQKKEAPLLYFDGKNYQFREDMEVILVMGIDNQEQIGDTQFEINNSQADVLYVFAIDHKNKTYQAIQLNRDTMTGVQTYFADGSKDEIATVQICLSHGYGKSETARCLNTVDAVSGLLFNVPIDHYISLNMSAISVLNEQVGGVIVTVPAGLETVDPSFVEGKTIQLQGNQAELFVRSRMSLENDTNEFRMQRQQIFFDSWKQQAEKKMHTEDGFALNLVLSLSDYMVSDMTANALADFADQLSEYEDLGTLKTQGEMLEAGEDRPFREYYVDQDDLERKVIDLFYEEADKQSED